MIAHTTHNVGFLPRPNRVEIILTDTVAPVALTKTAFVVPVFEDGTFLLASNRRRGIETPGGHVDDGETLEQAAIREAYEETGAMVGDLIPIGYCKMISEGVAPEDWQYPHPESYQQFYAGIICEVTPFVPNDECLPPFHCSDLNDRRISRIDVSIFGAEARRRLGVA